MAESTNLKGTKKHVTGGLLNRVMPNDKPRNVKDCKQRIKEAGKPRKMVMSRKLKRLALTWSLASGVTPKLRSALGGQQATLQISWAAGYVVRPNWRKTASRSSGCVESREEREQRCVTLKFPARMLTASHCWCHMIVGAL